jgi:5'-methylthioadenosine phosphorylase
MVGVEQLISVSAVGSLKEAMKPTDLVIPDQYVDSTFKRDKTFFEKGIAAHVPMDEPTCTRLAGLAESAANTLNLTVHNGGTYYNMEGPQFSSRAESQTYRKLGYDIIGMTQAVEAKLAKELEMCFLPLAFVTDYDCWHHDVEPVSVEIIIKNFAKNSQNAVKLVEVLAKGMTSRHGLCRCSNSLQNNIITDAEAIPEETYRKLEPVIGKYLKKNG